MHSPPVFPSNVSSAELSVRHSFRNLHSEFSIHNVIVSYHYQRIVIILQQYASDKLSRRTIVNTSQISQTVQEKYLLF